MYSRMGIPPAVPPSQDIAHLTTPGPQQPCLPALISLQTTATCEGPLSHTLSSLFSVTLTLHLSLSRPVSQQATKVSLVPNVQEL